MRDQSGSYLAVIKVVGAGGGGTNAVNRMIEAGLRGCEFVAVNTDAQALLMSEGRAEAPHRHPPHARARGRRRPQVGEEAALESKDEIKEALKGADMVFITAGEGGGTGTGAAPVIAEIAREDLKALTVGVVTRPFNFEGRKRAEQAQNGIAKLREKVDTLIIIPNDRLLQVVEKRTSVVDAFRMADEVLRQGVQGITDLITVPGLVNLDFADVRTIMTDAGSALMGIGEAEGENRPPRQRAQPCRLPLLEASVEGATGILLNITGGARSRPLRGERGCRGRHRRRRSQRQRHLRRRDRREHAREGARDRDRDGFDRRFAVSGARRGLGSTASGSR